MTARASLLKLYIPIALLILATALALRFESSGNRPLHADEAVQAYQTWQLSKGEGYHYDPADKHGPTLYYLSSWLGQLRGLDPDELAPRDLRLLSIGASSLLIVTILSIRKRIGSIACLVTATLVAISPLCVIYGAYFIQESLLAIILWLLAIAIWSYFEKPKQTTALAIGLLVGLAIATKETAVLHFLSLIPALWLARPKTPREPIAKPSRIIAALAGALSVWLLFYSSFFSNPQGLVDSIAAYGKAISRSTGQGHEKPGWYYLSMLWPLRREGVLWGETVFILCSIAGLFLMARPKAICQRFTLYLSLQGIFSLLLYSSIPYKTPWLLLIPYTLLCPAVGYLVARAWEGSKIPWSRYACLAILLALFADQGRKTFLATNRYAADSRNPYIYQHTSQPFEKLAQRLTTLLPRNPSIAVYSPDHAWPLPWVLRNHPKVGYWQNLESFSPSHDIILIDSRLGSEDDPSLESEYSLELHGLRPNTLLQLYISEEA